MVILLIVILILVGVYEICCRAFFFLFSVWSALTIRFGIHNRLQYYNQKLIVIIIKVYFRTEIDIRR